MMTAPTDQTPEERLGNAVQKAHDKYYNKTDEELRQTSPKVFFSILGVLLLLAGGMVAYAWGNSTRIRIEYQGVAYSRSLKMCGAYALTRWFTPEDQRLPKPDQWRLLVAEVKDKQVPTLSTSAGSCRADQTTECCALMGLSVTGLPPRDLWNKPSWELPPEYQ